MQAKSLYRVRFNEDFNKILYSEKVFIGERIRDIVYMERERDNVFLMCLEDSGSIGVLKAAN